MKQPGGVEVGALPADGDVKMRAGGSAGATAEADFLAAGYGVSFFHFEFGEMEVEGEESLAVVDHHAVAFEIEKAGQQHGAGIHGRHRGSGGDAEIQALMFALGHTVEDSLRTVDVGYGSFGGRGEVAVPSAVRRDAIQIVLLDLLAFLGLLQLLRIGLGEFLFDRELNFDLRIMRASDGEAAGEGQRSFAGVAFRG